MLLSFRVESTRRTINKINLLNRGRVFNPDVIDTTDFFSIQNTNSRIRVGNIRTRRPIRIILKAPFHYKVGKHRLSLVTIQKSVQVGLGVRKAKSPSTTAIIIRGLGVKLEHLPRLTNPQLQTKRLRAALPFTLDKEFFKN